MSSDEEMVLVRYIHGNKGQHPVRGQATKTFYGHRSGGESFLVHRSDIALQPHLYIPVDQVTSRAVSTAEPAPIPESTFDAEAYLEKMRSKWNKDLDLETLPGVTTKVAINMRNSGFTTRDAILRAGAQGLQEAVSGIGEAKAEMIIAYLESVGDGD